MKGILKKTQSGWIVNYDYTVNKNDWCTLPLHPADVEQINKDSQVFDNIEARIAAYPEIEFEIVTEWDNGEVGVNGLTYAKLLHHSVEPNEMIDHIGDTNKMVEEYGATCNQLYKEWLKLGFEAGYNKAKDVLVNNRSGALTNISGAVSTKGGAVSVVEDDVEKLAEEFKNQYIKVGVTEDEVSAFIVGYLKAKETLYTKEDVLKAGEIGEINHYDYKHIVSLLDEAKAINQSLKK